MEKRRVKASEFYEWLFDTIARMVVEGDGKALVEMGRSETRTN